MRQTIKALRGKLLPLAERRANQTANDVWHYVWAWCEGGLPELRRLHREIKAERERGREWAPSRYWLTMLWHHGPTGVWWLVLERIVERRTGRACLLLHPS